MLQEEGVVETFSIRRLLVIGYSCMSFRVDDGHKLIIIRIWIYSSLI